MGPETFLSFLPAVIGLSFVGFLAIAVAVFQDGRQDMNKADIVKRGYIYLVSFITILLVALAAVSLLDLGLRNLAFKNADPVPGFYDEQPPQLFLAPAAKTEATPPPDLNLSCTGTCTLTDQQKQDVASWAESYQAWLQRQPASTRVFQTMVTPISFLLIAGVVFLFHWRLVIRDRKRLEEAHNLTRSTYFTAMSFVWLLTVVFSAGFLLNTVLKSVLPGSESATPGYPRPTLETGTSATSSIVTCGEKCGLSTETIELGKSWQTANASWLEKQNAGSAKRTRDNNLAVEIAFFIVAAPLFWLHFRTAWREKKPSPTAPTAV